MISHDQEFEVFFREYCGLLWGYIYRRSLDAPPDFIDDVVMTSFLATRRHWARVRSGSPKAYLFVVARRASIRHHQRRYQREEPRADVFELTEPRAAMIDNVIDRVVLESALRCLPQREREAVVLRHLAGLSVSDTAVIMEVAEGTVKGYTSEGLARLRKYLSDESGQRR